MQLPTKKIELDQLHWTCYLAEPIPVHTKTDPVRAAKFTKNTNDHWDHAGGFATSISTQLQ